MPAMNINATRRDAGFSLVEMAIVLVIVTLLLSGMLPALSGQVEQRHVSETSKQLDEIRQALIGYAIINGRLPCPADGAIATGLANAGREATTGTGSAMTCSNAGSVRVLPWATLGVGETDAWGRRFTYRVTTTFADGTDGTGCTGAVTAGASFQLCSSGNLNVLSAATGGANVVTNIPVVVISHGANGLGAYTTGGQQIFGASGDESENADNDNIFVSHDFMSSPKFDDIVVWLPPSILLNRMVAAGKLP